jgi:hypothetical protein
LVNCTVSGNSDGISNAGILSMTNSAISGNLGRAVFNSGTFTMTSSLISGNSSEGVFNYGTLTVSNSTISNNMTAGGGGGIFNLDGPLTVTNSTISSNTAAFGGGGISNHDGSVTITNSFVSENTTTLGTGGISNRDGSLIITNSHILENLSSSSGSGGISSRNGALTVTNSTISGNSTSGPGGGIVSQGNLTVTNSTISNNTAGSGAGGVAFGGSGNGTFTLTNSTISGNMAYASGGMALSDTIIVANSAISDNISYAGAGGVFVEIGGVLTMTDSTISGNIDHGTVGGGMVNVGTATVTNSTISSNSTSRAGGGVNNVGSFILSNSTLSGNTAGSSGGGLFNRNLDDSTVIIINSTISTNTAGSYGGGLYNRSIDGSTITVTNSTISGNSTGVAGGGVTNYSGNLTLARNLISGNTAPIGQEVSNVGSGTVVTDNYNLFGHNTIGGAVGFTLGTTDIVPSQALSEILAPLADNGGPTLTHALVTDSPAIDASPTDADCPATDQRGVSRPQGTACDIGAFEGGIEGPGLRHDAAILKVTASKTITLTSKKPLRTQTVKVQLQNQGELDETIPDAATLASLMQVDLKSLDTGNNCPDLVATLDDSKLKFPLVLKAGKNLKPGKKLILSFTVTFDQSECIPDPLKSSKKDPGHEDYRPHATLDFTILGQTDVDPTDNTLEGAFIDVVKKP